MKNHLVESIESDTGRIVGVQWHPELILATHAHARRLFDTFIACCRCGRISSFSSETEEME